MDPPDVGRRGTAAVVLGVLALLLVAGAVGAGALQDAQERPSGEAVLDRATQRYESAESVAGTATVVASNDSRTERASVAFAVAEPDRFHVAVTHGNESVEVGSNGTVAWATVANRTVAREIPAGNASGWNASALRDGQGHDGLPWVSPGGNATRVAPGVSNGSFAAPGLPNGSFGGPALPNGSFAAPRLPNGSSGGQVLPNGPFGDHGMPGVPGANRSMEPPNVTATVTGVETVDGERAYVVSIEPAGPADRSGAADRVRHGANGTVWVATEDYRVLRATATAGTHRVSVRFDDQQFDVSVHDSEFAPPADRVGVTGAERFEDRPALVDATDLELPALEDAGFVAGQRLTRPGSEAVVQQYRTGERNVSLVTATGEAGVADRLDGGTPVTVVEHDATAVTLGDRTAVAWTEDGVTTAVVVDGDAETAVEIARGV